MPILDVLDVGGLDAMVMMGWEGQTTCRLHSAWAATISAGVDRGALN